MKEIDAEIGWEQPIAKTPGSTGAYSVGEAKLNGHGGQIAACMTGIVSCVGFVQAAKK